MTGVCPPDGTKHGVIHLSFNVLLVCLLVQWRNLPVSTQISQSRSACPSLQQHEVGPPVAGRMTWGHSTTVKNACSLLNTHLVHTASQRLQGLWFPPRGAVPFYAALTKKMHAEVS